MNQSDLQARFWVGHEDTLEGGLVDHLWWELQRAIDKHGWDLTPMSSAPSFDKKYRLIGEEFGEVSKAYDHGTEQELLDELLQVAAMAAGTWMSIKFKENRE